MALRRSKKKHEGLKELGEGEGLTHEEWQNKRTHLLSRKRSAKTMLNLGKMPRYCRSKREKKGSSVKYRLTERFGDKEERSEKNKRYPFVKLADSKTQEKLLLPDGKTRGQAWGAIRKLWWKVRICNSKGDYAGKEDACRLIRREQENLGIKLTEFDDPELKGQYLTQEERNYLKERDKIEGTGEIYQKQPYGTY